MGDIALLFDGLSVSVSFFFVFFVECGYVFGRHRGIVFALDHKNMSRLFCRLLFLLLRRLVSGMMDGG